MPRRPGGKRTTAPKLDAGGENSDRSQELLVTVHEAVVLGVRGGFSRIQDIAHAELADSPPRQGKCPGPYRWPVLGDRWGSESPVEPNCFFAIAGMLDSG